MELHPSPTENGFLPSALLGELAQTRRRSHLEGIRKYDVTS